MRLITLLILLLCSMNLFAQADSSIHTVLPQKLDIDTVDQTMLDRAQTLAASGDFSAAMKQYQLLLNQLLPEFDSEDPAVNPSEINLYYISPLVLKVLLEKSKLFEQLADAKDRSGMSLEPALATQELIVDALFHLRQNDYGSALAYDNGKADREQEWEAINLAYKLYEKSNNPSYLLRCFRLVEKSKKSALSNALVDPQTSQLANVPPENLELMGKSKVKVGALKSKWAKALHDANNKNTDAVAAAKNNFIVERKAYNRKLSEFSKKYPNAFALRYNESIVTVGEIQNRLQNTDQGLLSYYHTPEYIYGFVITLSGLKAKRIKRPLELNDQIIRFHSMLANQEEQSNCKDYDVLALDLYETIVQPFEPLKKELTVVPDGLIGYLPFNALLSTSPSTSCEFSTYPYLLNRYQFSFHYSAEEFAKEAYAKHSHNGMSFVAIGSDEQAYVNKLNRQLKGKYIKADGSAEEQLVNTIHSAGMVLSASDVQTYAGENRNSALPLWKVKGQLANNPSGEVAELVVLSNCNVTPALVPEGDHTPNIVRGLFYYDARSVLSTLWPLPEAANEYLLLAFFKQLKKGTSKRWALQSSNQSYLKRAKASVAAAPSQWAAYTLIGNADPLTDRNWYWLLLGIIPLFVLWYYWRKRKRAKRLKDREVTTTMEY